MIQPLLLFFIQSVQEIIRKNKNLQRDSLANVLKRKNYFMWEIFDALM